VSKKFNKSPAVQGLSLAVRKGEIYGLIGPNGSGKTTTIKMCIGLIRPSSGSIRVAGYDVVDYPTSAKKRLGYVPDDPVAYERLTGREFLEFVGELYGMDRKLRENRIDALLDSYGVRDLADGLFMGFSRGMKQKITMCAALLHEPDMLFIDEPMVGLDPQSVRVTERLLTDFAGRGGAILLSTHTLPVAETICQRFGLLQQGRLIAEGPIAAIRKKAGLPEGTLEECYLRLVGADV
jgi:ABC-2 type transport system ATP-binding protein